MDYKSRYEAWLNNDYFSAEFREELKALEGNEKEIEERFYKDMEFGTGGMRGIIGAGTNRMNEYVIRKASQGFANFAQNRYENNSIVIAYDCRHKSPEFALETALVFAGNGIKAYLFESLHSTPELSYAVRELKASVGVVVTASHNPPAYNGFKVYGDDGCQLLPVDADKVVEEVNKIESFDEVKYISKEEAVEKGLLVYLDDIQDNKYLDMVESEAIDSEIIADVEDLKIVYTALHGTGARPIQEIMKRRGLKHFYPVEEQMVPDADFSTLESPNPEDVSAFEYGIKLAKEKDADVVIATDPDCDRVGLVVKTKNGYEALNGNQTGVLLVDYVLGNIKEMPENPLLVNTIVTSGMAEKVIKSYGAELESTLTGFKFIGEKIKQYEDGSKNFLFGYEESYGYLAGTHVRDKDAVIATMLVVEMVAMYKKQGLTLVDVLEKLYEKVGYYQESLTSIVLEGKEGLEKIKRIMSSLRTNPIQTVTGLEVSAVMDCLNQTITDKNGKKDNGLPSSNVLKYYLEDGSWFAARPSGTEPKLKIYFSVADETRVACLEKLAKVEKEILEIVNSVE
ncbi:MAG: phospho-sugar mutase [Clostridiales bacterium]|nr:phospho-sugar mutase [Clostridiales bacterium]